MKSIKTLVAVGLFAVSGWASANILYSFNYAMTVGTGSASGSILTDGALGTLSGSDVLDWTINLNGSPGGTFTLTGPLSGGNSQLGYAGGIVASATQLTFDFSAPSGYVLFQNPSTGSGVNYLCYAAQLCGNFSNAINIGTNVFGVNSLPLSGVQVIAAAVPEPATLALWGVGLALVGFARPRARADRA